MPTFENLLLGKYSTEFYDMAHTQSHSPWVCVIKVFSNGVAT